MYTEKTSYTYTDCPQRHNLCMYRAKKIIYVQNGLDRCQLSCDFVCIWKK